MIYLYIVLFFMPFAHAFDQQVVFDKASQLYQDGSYSEAISLYQKIESKGPGVWHNIGNCHWHLQQFKDAFFAYKRAFKDASLFDKLLLKEQIVRSWQMWTNTSNSFESPILSRDIVISFCTAFEWQMIFLIMWIVWLLCITRSRRRLFFRVSSCMVFVLLMVIMYAMVCAHGKEMPHGVIIEPTKLFVAPKKEVHALKDLLPGDDVIIVDSCRDWAKVKAQGVLGWVAQSDCQLL